MTTNKDIKSLYVHIPFCHSLCAYCDFPKLLAIKSFIHPYLLSLKKELDSYYINKDLDTLYIGGGTPTSLDDEEFSFLLSMLDEYTSNIKEYTIEANPESLSKNKLEMMKIHGVNRLSIGVESTNDDILKSINRLHTFDDVKKVMKEARNLGFDNISLDLILGLPGVNDEMLKEDIKRIIKLKPNHISCYSLTIHDHTKMGIDRIEPPNDDEMRKKYDLVASLLHEEGYQHYEISNWCKDDKMSLHNLTYWKDEKYFGVGLGASGYVNNYRYTNTLNISEYIKGKYIQTKDNIDQDDDFEYLMLSLRTILGVNYQEYQRRFHEGFLSKYLFQIKKNDDLKYFIFEKDHCYLNYEGMMILDTIFLNLIS